MINLNFKFLADTQADNLTRKHIRTVLQVELEPWLAAGVRTAARCPEPVQVTVVPGRGPGPAAQAEY